MNKYKVLIVDDELIMCEELSCLVKQVRDVEVIGECYDGDSALQLIAKKQPDIVFLDIQMPEMSGLKVASILRQRNQFSPVIIFATAFDNFALDAFGLNVIDYILKPFDEVDIQRVLQKAKHYLAQEKQGILDTVKLAEKPIYPQKFSFENKGKMDIVDNENIQMIYAKDRLVYIQTLDGLTYTGKLTLQDFEKLLDPNHFYRCHRNYIVNLKCIAQLNPWFNRGFMLTLRGNKEMEVQVSRNFVHGLRKFIQF